MENMLDLIKLSLWNSGTAEASVEIFEEMKKHNIASLPAHILSTLPISDELKREWKKYIFHQMTYLSMYQRAEMNLPISVPYIILKGTAAAQYYPYPEYRAMGDIDIYMDRGNFDRAYQDLTNNGYIKIKELDREIVLEKEGIIVELHRYFASLNDVNAAKYMDDLIIANISSSHILPDMINGLVLLEHISQHLEHGLGLRQIIDWMMFVDKYLTDAKWVELKPMAKKIGLDKLAVITTRMCEIYLGLSERTWCAQASVDLCQRFMEYILSCGDFGNKKTTEADITETVFTYARSPRAAFRLLKRQGLANWKAAQKHKPLRHFAWIYQLFRYISKGLNRENAALKIKKEYDVAQKRNQMFDELGVKTTAKGLVIYKNGEYRKE